jgi:heterodisulfide reductase subunit B
VPAVSGDVAVYQSEINQRPGTRLATPVTYYSEVMTVAYGGTAKKAGLDGHLIQFAKLQEIAAKVTK